MCTAFPGEIHKPDEAAVVSCVSGSLNVTPIYRRICGTRRECLPGPRVREISRRTRSPSFCHLYIRLIFAYAFIYVPGTVSTKDVRCCLQEMPARRPDRCW